MNAYLIFGLVALAAFGMFALGKVFAAIGMVLLLGEAVAFAFYVLFKVDNVAEKKDGPHL